MVNYCILLIAMFTLHPNNVNANCQDYFGRIVIQGMHYVPGPDTCTLCVCDNSVAKWCKAVLCSPPQDCKSFTVGSTCCEFNCLDDSLNDSGDIDYKGDNINARSIASTITAFLFFILIVFLINRLHKRNIMSNVEVFANSNSPQMGDGVRGIGYISGYMNFPRSLGNDLYYGDHATLHIPLWKTYYPRGDAPPPYDEAIAMPQQISQNFIGMGEIINHRTIPDTVTETNQNIQQPCISEPELTANQPLLDNALKKTACKESISNEKRNTTSSEDFREECENCKHDQKHAEGYDGNFPEPETMTLERRPQITHEHTVDRNEPRSSMTLPGDGRHGRSHVIKDKNRDELFKETIVKEDSISDDENS